MTQQPVYHPPRSQPVSKKLTRFPRQIAERKADEIASESLAVTTPLLRQIDSLQKLRLVFLSFWKTAAA